MIIHLYIILSFLYFRQLKILPLPQSELFPIPPNCLLDPPLALTVPDLIDDIYSVVIRPTVP